MGKRAIRIIGYGILFVMNIWLLWFFHSFLNLAILAVLVFMPVASILGTKLAAASLQVHWDGPIESMVKEEEFQVRLQIQNTSWFGVMHGKAYLTVSNCFYQTAKEHELRIPIRARKGQTVTYPITVYQCGNVEFRLRELILEDFFGLVAFRKPLEEHYTVVVLPKEREASVTAFNGYTLGMEEVEENNRKGNDFSEVQDVREYQPGDKMQNIHWKLSVKKDNLMVKERVSMSSRQLFLLPELYDEQGSMEEILECTHGICLLMLHHQLPVTLLWWSQKTQELVSWKVDHLEHLEEGFRMLYYESLYQEPALGRTMAQTILRSGHQFLWVGSRKNGVGAAIAEYGTVTGVYYGNQT